MLDSDLSSDSDVGGRIPPMSVALAAIGPLAVGGVLAARLQDLAPMIAVPGVVFAVAALTLPAL
jgi:hypothetical protein